MIGELYVPRGELVRFLERARAELVRRRADVVYGTVRWIERDRETFLAWAREPWACVVLNLHLEHSPAGVERTAGAFRALIDIAHGLGGTYYLTYHRWATRAQLEACHPRLWEFLVRKLELDPTERFTSDGYRHHVALLGKREVQRSRRQVPGPGRQVAFQGCRPSPRRPPDPARGGAGSSSSGSRAPR